MTFATYFIYGVAIVCAIATPFIAIDGFRTRRKVKQWFKDHPPEGESSDG